MTFMELWAVVLWWALNLLNFIPITPSFHAFLLNRIDMGQFLYMKYKVGISNNKPVYTNILSCRMRKLSFIQKLVNTINGTVSTITQTKESGKLLFNSLPYLLKNFLSEYMAGFNLDKKYGTKVTVNRNASSARIGTFPENKSTILELTTIPNQNIRFQKLSRFSLDLIGFILLLGFSYNHYVIILSFSCSMQIKIAIYSYFLDFITSEGLK